MALDAMIETELDSQGLVAIRNVGSRDLEIHTAPRYVEESSATA